MDLNTVTSVTRPTTREQLPTWSAGDAWLAGGTWLFSEPQTHLTRLIDLTDLKWPALTVTDSELQIAATCTVAQLDALACPPDWIASPLINQCCRAFLASFKRRSAFRQISLTPVGRSAALLIGSSDDDGLRLTITASTKRPVRIVLPALPDADTLEEAILDRIPDNLYHDDVHGKPAWRKQMTLRLAEEIRAELQGVRP